MQIQYFSVNSLIDKCPKGDKSKKKAIELEGTIYGRYFYISRSQRKQILRITTIHKFEIKHFHIFENNNKKEDVDENIRVLPIKNYTYIKILSKE